MLNHLIKSEHAARDAFLLDDYFNNVADDADKIDGLVSPFTFLMVAAALCFAAIAVVVVFFSPEINYDNFNHSTDRTHSSARWCTAILGLLPQLGRCAFRPAWNCRDCAHHSNVNGPDLTLKLKEEKHAWYFTVADRPSYPGDHRALSV
jgi:hypothetical protein